jgi:predicted transcriptional regulator
MLLLLARVLDPIELDIMQLLWSRDAMTSNELYLLLQAQRNLTPATLMTALSRLVEQGVLRRGVERQTTGAIARYTARLSRADVLAAGLAKLGDDLGARRSEHPSVVQQTLAAVRSR